MVAQCRLPASGIRPAREATHEEPVAELAATRVLPPEQPTWCSLQSACHGSEPRATWAPVRASPAPPPILQRAGAVGGRPTRAVSLGSVRLGGTRGRRRNRAGSSADFRGPTFAQAGQDFARCFPTREIRGPPQRSGPMIAGRKSARMEASDFRGPPVEDRSETRRVGRAPRGTRATASSATCSSELRAGKHREHARLVDVGGVLVEVRETGRIAAFHGEPIDAEAGAEDDGEISALELILD